MNTSEDFIELVDSINHISLNYEDLMSICLEYSAIYFKNKQEEMQAFDKFWANRPFLDQATLAAREGVVMGMQAITLREDIPFESVLNRCVHIEMQRHAETQMSDNPHEIQAIREFLSSLRKELFSRTFSQNKSLQKVSKLSRDLLDKRYQLFMSQAF